MRKRVADEDLVNANDCEDVAVRKRVPVEVFVKFNCCSDAHDIMRNPIAVFSNEDEIEEVPTRVPTPTDRAEDVPVKSALPANNPRPALVCSNRADIVAESTKIAAGVVV